MPTLKQRFQCASFIVAVGLTPAVLAPAAIADTPLSMADYLRLALHNHVRTRQYQAEIPAQDAALRVARQRYIPEVTVRSSWDESETARVRNPEPMADTPFQARGGALPLGWTVPGHCPWARNCN